MGKLKDISGMNVSQLMYLLRENLPEITDVERMQMALWLWADMKLQPIYEGAANFKEFK